MKRYRTSPEESDCLHRNPLWGMCVLCGEPIIVPENDTNIKKRAVTLEKQAKLSLVLDLDNTLLNSTPISGLTKSEAVSLKPLAVSYPSSSSSDHGNNASGQLFVSEEKQMMTKLRPLVRTFLEEVSRLFDLYIFTMGSCNYAAAMVSLLDPESRYFDKTRVFSRDNVSYRKGLSIVPVVRSACVIIDDKMESVWPNDKRNVIQIDGYNYFASSCNDRKSLSELMTDESEVDGALAKILRVLRRVHATYYGQFLYSADVREILKTIRKDTLGGCKVLFSSCVVDEEEEEDLAYTKLDLEMKAVELGAIWAARVDETVTHVVAADPASEEAMWAAKEGKFLVNPKWIETAYYLWERPSETMYPVTWW